MRVLINQANLSQSHGNVAAPLPCAQVTRFFGFFLMQAEKDINFGIRLFFYELLKLKVVDFYSPILLANFM